MKNSKQTLKKRSIIPFLYNKALKKSAI